MAALNLPGKNVDLKKKEHEELFGKDVKLSFHLPDGNTHVMHAKESNEVGLVRLLFAKEAQLDPSQVKLFFKGKPLLDPMSLCDHPGLKAPAADIEVRSE